MGWKEAAKKRQPAKSGNASLLKLEVATGYDQLSGRTGTLMYMVGSWWLS